MPTPSMLPLSAMPISNGRRQRARVFKKYVEGQQSGRWENEHRTDIWGPNNLQSQYVEVHCIQCIEIQFI